MAPRTDIAMTVAEARSFLETPRTAVLSTLGPDGLPHMAAMWFTLDPPDDPAASTASVGGDSRAPLIRMWTYGKSQKARNLYRDLRCAVLVEEGRDYFELRGVLIRGRGRLLEDVDEVADIGRRLYERYTQPLTGIPFEGAPEAEVRRQAPKRVGISLAARVVSWDHRKLH